MKCCIITVAAFLTLTASAGPAGLLIKGVAKSWDEVAKVALKVSGKSATDDAVKGAVKTLQTASEKYGDDVVEAAMHGGMEVAEQSLRHGGKFAALIGRASKMSSTGLRELALHSDDAMQLTARYGDDILKLNSKTPGIVSRGVKAIEKSGVGDPASAIKAISELPAEDIPRIIGALEKNQSVGRELIEHIEKGGKLFVDKVFALNSKQIMAGGLSAAAIVAAYSVTDPKRAEGENIRKDGEKARGLVDGLSPEEKWKWIREHCLRWNLSPWTFTIMFVAILIGVVSFKKFRRKPPQSTPGNSDHP